MEVLTHANRNNAIYRNNIGTETWVFEVDYARLRDVPIEAAQGVTCMVWQLAIPSVMV